MNNSPKKKFLIVGHQLVVNTNRKIYSTMAKMFDVEIDIIAPVKWKANLIRNLHLKRDSLCDAHTQNLFGVPCRFKGKGNLFFFSPLRTLRILNTKIYDAIYLLQEPWTMSATIFNLARMFSSNSKTPFFYGVDQNMKKFIHHFSKYIERWNSKEAQAYLCSNTEIESVLRWKGVETPCIYRPYFYSKDLLSNISSLDFKGVLKLGYLGRLTHEKGLEDLLEAFTIAKGLNIPIELHIAGSGPMENEVKNTKDVIFHGSFNHDSVASFYEKIHALILPSRTTRFWKEQFGRVLVESVAAGRIPIGSSSGAIPEVLGKLGLGQYVFQEKNPRDIVRVMNMLHQDFSNNKITPLIIEASKRNKELFSEEAVATLLFQTFTK